MQEPNFKCPKTNKKYYITNYRIIASITGDIYKDKYGRLLVSEDGEKLIPIQRDRGIPIAIFGDKQKRLVKHQEFFRERAKKHANTIDQKINKRDTTRKEMSRYMKNQKL